MLVILLVVGGALRLAERLAPRRTSRLQPAAMRARWGVNAVLFALGMVALWWLGPWLQTLAIQWGLRWGWGGLVKLDLPFAAKIALGVLLADVLQYLIHRASHSLPPLWRLHQVHHADEVVDVTTMVRHHPLESLVSLVLFLFFSAALGMPLLSLMIYALLQWTHGLFCHSNIAVPESLDRWLRWLVVTPDMHRIHHSAEAAEGNSNYAQVFPWWDRMLGSYCAAPVQGHTAMRLGLFTPQQAGAQGLWRSLTAPLRS